MSWNKNTIITSTIDDALVQLTDLQVPFKLIELGRVRALGLNDIVTEYPIRMLSFRAAPPNMEQTIYIYERMERSHDCDFDDYLTSHRFAGKKPKKWDLEVYTDEP